MTVDLPVPSPLGAGDAGALAVVQREGEELRASIMVARTFPRDEVAVFLKIGNSCDRPAFAEGAAYSFRRGRETITGPSVKLAREIARLWGNLRYGVRIVSVDATHVHIRGQATDLETNATVESEAKFARLQQRRVGKGADATTEWVEPNERDLRELTNKHGAICMRNALLQLLPPEVVDAALVRCGDALEAAAKGDVRDDRDGTIRILVESFDKVFVTLSMLEEHLGHPIANVDENEVADLRRIFVGLRDGASDRRDFFTVRPALAAADLTSGAQAPTTEPGPGLDDPVE